MAGLRTNLTAPEAESQRPAFLRTLGGRKAVGHVAVALLVIALGGCAWLSIRAFQANHHWDRAFQALGKASPLPHGEWLEAMGELREGLRHSPRHPWSLELLGREQLARMHPGMPGVPGEDADAPAVAAQLAHLHFRRALAQRPTSAFAWANLALARFHMRQADDSLLAALRHADALAPWEPPVQHRVLWVGLNLWDRLDAPHRAAMLATLERALHRDPRRTAEIAHSTNRLQAACASPGLGSRVQALCREAGGVP